MKMLALALASVLAVAAAAPYYHHHHHHGHRPFSGHMTDDTGFFNDDDMFDTRSFWRELETGMQELETMLNNFHTHFSTGASSAGYEGTDYKIKINMPGYEAKDIVVKSAEGVMMVQAIHKSEDGLVHKNYLDMRTVPTNVGEARYWSYAGGVLTVTFGVKGATTEVTPTLQTVTEAQVNPRATEVQQVVTQAPFVNREEMDSDKSKFDGDADVGLTDGTGKIDYRANEISDSDVEATTYAVHDVKRDFEFVPVNYR